MAIDERTLRGLSEGRASDSSCIVCLLGVRTRLCLLGFEPQFEIKEFESPWGRHADDQKEEKDIDHSFMGSEHAPLRSQLLRSSASYS